MAYRGEVLRRARERLADAKAQRESELARNLQLAYKQEPRLLEIDRALRRTMAETARNIFETGAEARAEFERIRKANLGLQEERKQILAQKFPAGFLNEAPICPKCGGTGYIGSQMCECLQELCRQEQVKELSNLADAGYENFESFRLDYYSDRVEPSLGFSPRMIMAQTLMVCKAYAENFSTKSNNLFLNGNPGLGKTFLSACIAREVAARGHSVIYESAVHLFSTLERAKFTNDAEAQHKAQLYGDCDLLIMDDLGAEMLTPFVQSALYTVLNDRLLTGKPTVVSSNLVSQDLSNRYGPAVASRLLGSFQLVTFLGQDVRIQKSRGI